MKRKLLILLIPLVLLVYGFQAGIRPMSVYDAIYLKIAGGYIGSSSHKTTFDATGHQTMTGDARPWRDQTTDAINIRIRGTGIAENYTESAMGFQTDADYPDDYLYLNIQLNHDKDLTGSIYPHIHFFQAENHVPNFLIAYRWQKNLGEKVTEWTLLKCNTLAEAYSGTTKNNIAMSTPIAIPAGGSQISDIIQFKIYRDTTDDSDLFLAGAGGADTYTATVYVTAFDVHFMINSLGSTDEYSK